jgi:hypothetical protein
MDVHKQILTLHKIIRLPVPIELLEVDELPDDLGEILMAVLPFAVRVELRNLEVGR